MNNVKQFVATLISTSAMVAGLSGSPALAQSSEQASALPGDIIVTARKREEDILKTPVTVVAITGEQLDIKGVKTMQDLAASTPGLNINDSSSGHADRSFQQIILRGMTPSTTLATTTSLFIDGVPIASPSAFTAISAPERIEILKGPQSAYFGRNTFAGAVNVVNSVPDGDWSATVTGMAGTRNNYRARVEVEGPIIGDALTFRATGEKFGKDGSWKNETNGETLGDQSSATGTLLIVAKPTDKLTIKLFGMIARDEDGPSAQTRILAQNIVAPGGTTVYASQSNCTVNGNPFICGTLPRFSNGVSANTEMSENIRNLLAIDTNRVVSPDDTVDHYGLLRHTRHAHGTLDYELNDQLSLSLLGGFNREKWSTLIDLDGFDTSMLTSAYSPYGYFDFPYLIERDNKDWSTEGRINFDFGKLRGVVGASYLYARSYSGGGSALSTASAASFYKGGKDQSETKGAYFGLTYDFTDSLSLSAEGRYQVDKLASYVSSSGLTVASDVFVPSGTYAAGTLLAKRTFKNFTPRIIANYQVSPELMLYASWAKGINPAQFNTGILSESAAIQQAAADAGMALTVDPEKMTNYEIGAKGRLFGGRMTYSLAAYYAQWRRQINSILLTLPNGTFTNGVENVSFVSGYANSGSVNLYGVEGQFAWRPIDLITIDGGGAINVTDIRDFASPTITALSGITDYSGKEMPNTSKYSANIGIQLGGDVKGQDDTTWFARADWNFKSGFYSSQANLAKTSDAHKVNVRAGLGWGDASIQVFVTNLFNNKAYTSATDNWTIEQNYAYMSTYSAVLVGLPELRTGGVEFKVKF
ncbi:TonB-dependent receptor [Novosphingobium guangzhouense]|uniref:TonB-dependent receptor n=1 Tax=Novosphingobium guangzhouense TaxID=1850347 RepID=A0A2K2G6K2_9SPHN|nr:TonB-dependent receptor [Novosphingobium guangzhouense]PNU06667.1 TonB-dependent receptor [Novosphingobium guangzhouense]